MTDDNAPAGPDQTPPEGGFRWAAPGSQPPASSSPAVPPPGAPTPPAAALPPPAYGAGASQPPPYAPPISWATPVRPGIVWLRPLDLGEILGGAFRLLRFNPKATVGFAFLVHLVGLVLALPVLFYVLRQFDDVQTDLEAGAEADPTVSWIGQLDQIPSALLTALATFVLMVVVSRAVLGERVTAGEAWRQARPSLWRYLGLHLLFFLAVVLLVGAGVGLVLLTPWVGVPVLVAVAVALVFFGIRLGFAGYAIVLERLGVQQGLRRSWALTAGQFWRILGIRLLVALVMSMVGAAVAFPFTIAAAVLGFATMSSADDVGTILGATIVASAVASALAGALSTPVTCAADTLLYLDQRIRREGLDVRLAAVVAERLPEER